MGEVKYNKIKLSLKELAEVLYGHEVEKKTPDGQLITISSDFDIEKAGDG